VKEELFFGFRFVVCCKADSGCFKLTDGLFANAFHAFGETFEADEITIGFTFSDDGFGRDFTDPRKSYEFFLCGGVEVD